MAISNPFTSLFGKSPIKPMQDHMTVACATANELVPFFSAVIANDWTQAEKNGTSSLAVAQATVI